MHTVSARWQAPLFGFRNVVVKKLKKSSLIMNLLFYLISLTFQAFFWDLPFAQVGRDKSVFTELILSAVIIIVFFVFSPCPLISFFGLYSFFFFLFSFFLLFLELTLLLLLKVGFAFWPKFNLSSLPVYAGLGLGPLMDVVVQVDPRYLTQWVLGSCSRNHHLCVAPCCLTFLFLYTAAQITKMNDFEIYGFRCSVLYVFGVFLFSASSPQHSLPQHWYLFASHWVLCGQNRDPTFT